MGIEERKTENGECFEEMPKSMPQVTPRRTPGGMLRKILWRMSSGFYNNYFNCKLNAECCAYSFANKEFCKEYFPMFGILLGECFSKHVRALSSERLP